MGVFNKYAKGCGLLMAGAVAFLPPATATAADAKPDVSVDDKIDTVIYWGIDYARNGGRKSDYGVGAGFVTALNGDMGVSGWTVTGNIGGARTDDAAFDTKSLYASALVGYLWHTPNYYFTLAGGVNYINNDETPPGGANDGAEVGAIAQYGFETKKVDAFYMQSYGAYSTAFDQTYVHAKAGYKTPDLRFGTEFTYFGETTSRSTLRYGGFIGDISITDSLSMVISAGYQHAMEPDVEDGFYATIGFAIPLSLR